MGFFTGREYLPQVTLRCQRPFHEVNNDFVPFAPEDNEVVTNWREVTIVTSPGFFLTQTPMIDMTMLRGWWISLPPPPAPLSTVPYRRPRASIASSVIFK